MRAQHSQAKTFLRFEFGLQRLLDGIAALLEEKPRPAVAEGYDEGPRVLPLVAVFPQRHSEPRLSRQAPSPWVAA